MNNPLIITTIIISLIILLIIFSRLNTSKQSERRRVIILNQLEAIKLQCESDNKFEWKDAVIKLDILLSKALNIKLDNTLSCGDNLKSISKMFKKDFYQKIWDVHKMRNEIVHRAIDISQEDCKEAYRVYKFTIERLLR